MITFNYFWDDCGEPFSWSYIDREGSYWKVTNLANSEETVPVMFGPITPQEWADIPF
jgi:hypothetical protein